MPWQSGLGSEKNMRPRGRFSTQQFIQANAASRFGLILVLEFAMGPFRDGWTEQDSEAVIARGLADELLHVPIVIAMDPPDCAW